MTEEEIKALEGLNPEYAQKARELLESVSSLSQAVEKEKQDKEKLVQEVIEERKKKQEALLKTNINKDEPVDVEKLVADALSKKEQERRQAEVQAAIEEFKRSKPEFQADQAGLVYSKFEGVLKRFNMADVSSKEEAKARLEEVYKFSKFKGEVPQDPAYEGTPSVDGSIPSATERQDKDTEEVLKATRITKERYSELKGKYGEAFESLGIR